MFRVSSEKKVKFNMKAALILVMILLPVIIAVRVIANVNSIEMDTGYARDALPIIHFVVVTVLSLVIIAFSRRFEIFYLTKSFDPEKGQYTPTNISPYSDLIFSKTSAIVVFMSAFLGFAMISAFFVLVFNFLDEKMLIINKIVMVALIIFLALSGMFFIISSAYSSSNKRNLCAYLSFTPVMWSALRIIMYFMDTSRYINTTARHLELLCSIMVTLFFMSQSRFTLQNFKYHKMGSLFAFGLSAIIFISSSSIPSIISTAFFPYTTLQPSTENDIIFWVLDVIILFYIIIRLWRISTQIDKVTCDDLMDYARGYTKSVLKSTNK